MCSKSGKRNVFQMTTNQLLYQQKRYRGKINIQKPKKPHYTRALVGEFLTPFYINPRKDMTYEELCLNRIEILSEKKELNPYETIIAREVRNWFDNSKMIACLHRNSMTREEQFELEVPLKRANMYYKSYGFKIVKSALQDTPYTTIEPLLTSYFAFVFSPEINVIGLEKILKKFPQVRLLAGILEKHVLNHDDFLNYGRMDITMARSRLVQVLQNAGGVNLNQQLTHHQSTLVTRLKQIGTSETNPNENNQSVPV